MSAHQHDRLWPQIVAAIAVVGFVLAVGLIVRDPIALFRAAPPAPAPALAACRPPTEHEQMYVITYWREGAIVAECMHIGTRGTYTRGRK